MRVFPQASPRPTGSFAEASLYASLARCALPWTAFHSLRLRAGSGWEGEGDFVIVNPDVGLLVLEVKGGKLELRDGHWFQNGAQLDKAPRDQAQGFVRKLIAELKAAGLETPPWGVACAFPDCEFSQPPSNGDLRELVLGARDLPYLDEALPKLFEQAVPEGKVRNSRALLAQLEAWWGKTWVPKVTLTDRAADAAARTVALDAQQYGLLEAAGETQRALVEGPAGSGKTLVATELCRRRAREGLRATYLCFTDALARAVQVQFDDPACPEPRPRAISIRQLAVDLLSKSGVPSPAANQEFWAEVSLNAAVDALPAEAERPEVVVVDEGQDFEAGDWLLVEALAGPRGLWVFRDQRQAFWTGRLLPETLGQTLGARLQLHQRYRCPAGLAAFADCFATGQTPTRAPPRDEVRFEPAAPAELEARARHLVDQLRKDGVRPGDIALISLAGQTRSAFFGLERLGSHRLVHADAPDAGEHVIVETFMRFKGLERPFVIICEASGPHLTHFETRMHIALTRATVQAIVLAEPAAVAADPRLRLLEH
jgi:hypothetical protein